MRARSRPPRRRRSESARAAVTLASLALVLATFVPAEARTEREISHRFERVWPTAVRFIRVDQNYAILEKDETVGYVIFELEEDGRRFRGSLELIRTRDPEGRRAVKVVIQVEDRPEYVERIIMDRFLRKVRDELGEPPPPPPEEEEDEDKAGDEAAD